MAYLEASFLAVDFFCGAGGTTRGMLDAGGYVIAGIDRDGGCESTYVTNNTNTTLDRRPPHFLNRDVFPASEWHPCGQQDRLFREVEGLVERYRGLAPRIPLVFAVCAPCQPFTTLARKELSTSRIEKRNRDKNLLSEALVFIERFMPDIVLSENVAGVTDKKFGGIWTAFASDLERLGYRIGTKMVCASMFGVPQYRRRTIMVAGRRESLRTEYRDCESLPVPSNDMNARVTGVKETIGHLPPIRAGERHPTFANHRARSLSETNIKRMASAAPGESNAYLARTAFGDLSLDCHRRAEEKLGVKCFSDVYTRMHPDRPSPTITTKCHSVSNGRFGHFDVTQNRGISLREAASLQSFPEDYLFDPCEALEVIARMIGNAVPPRLARFFAEHALTLIGA